MRLMGDGFAERGNTISIYIERRPIYLGSTST